MVKMVDGYWIPLPLGMKRGFGDSLIHIVRLTSNFIIAVIMYISSTSGGRSVGIVRSRTKGHGVCFFFLSLCIQDLWGDYIMHKEFMGYFKIPFH
jgi:hypothetical protein